MKLTYLSYIGLKPFSFITVRDIKMDNSNDRIQQCTNCGLTGHIFRNCLSPITSYGLIAVRYLNDNNVKSLHSNKNNIDNGNDSIQFLLIQRRISISFIEFIRGKYNLNDDAHIGFIMRGMTKHEQSLLTTSTFDELWKYLWGKAFVVKSYKIDYDTCEKRFEQIRGKMETLVKNNPTQWDEPEWGFPKGRRNLYETDLNCAIREFQEETALKKNNFTVIQNTCPISETFFGSNKVHYCHKYYIAICDSSVEVEMKLDNFYMAREICAIKWCSLDEATSKIRPDNVEKREILLKAGRIMRNFHPVHTNDVPRSIQRMSNKN
jgi:8-oxo-dGTP pyrophosphatase MutT (NUDIX family)